MLSERKKPAGLPVGYPAFLADLKARIRTAQIKASLSVNRELIALYWHIGQSIVQRQRAEGWGKAVVERLSSDLQNEFPGIAGFSPQNIWKMRSFYLAWSEDLPVLAQPVRELGRAKLSQAVRELDGTNTPLIVMCGQGGDAVPILKDVLIFLLETGSRLLYSLFSKPAGPLPQGTLSLGGSFFAQEVPS
jgi:hypothetical protein